MSREEGDNVTHDFSRFATKELLEEHLFARMVKGETALLNREPKYRLMEIRKMGECGEWEGSSKMVKEEFSFYFPLEFRYEYMVYLKELNPRTDYGFIHKDSFHAFTSRIRTDVLRKRRSVKPAKVERREEENSN